MRLFSHVSVVRQLRDFKVFATVVIAFSTCLTSFAADLTEMRWGAVGHSDWVRLGPAYSYVKVPIDKQMQLLQTIGLGWYRTSCAASNCQLLISSAKANGINVLKAIALKPDQDTNEALNYKRAYAYGATEAKNYSSAFKYFEASNELDNWVGLKGDGSHRAQYNSDRYLQARGTIRGLIDGVHSANPLAKVMVDDSGWCHYGFLQMLWEDGVRWDITAFHWYSDQGNVEHAGCQGANVAAIHAAFGLPVWITEFNSKAAAQSNDPVEAAAWISSFISQVKAGASTYRIEGAFVYELLDEPNLSGMESHFGIYDDAGAAKAPSRAIAGILKSPAAISPMPPELHEVK